MLNSDTTPLSFIPYPSSECGAPPFLPCTFQIISQAKQMHTSYTLFISIAARVQVFFVPNELTRSFYIDSKQTILARSPVVIGDIVI